MAVNPVEMLALIAEATDARPYRKRAVFKRTLTNREIFRSSSENAPEVGFKRNVMIRLLHRERTTVTWQMRMLSEGKVLRRRKARQQCMEAALLWTEFAAGKRSAYKLLRACYIAQLTCIAGVLYGAATLYLLIACASAT